MNQLAYNIFAEFASTFQLCVKGLLIGIIASAPMGPVGVLCIQRTIQKGRKYGLVTGAGAALSDIIYALITGAGMSLVIDLVNNTQYLYWLKIIGSAMLFCFGLWVFFSDPRKGIRHSSRNKGSLLKNFVTSFLVTLSNPTIIFLFIALFNMLTFVIPVNWFGMCAGYASIVCGAMLWWSGLTYVITRMAGSFGLHGIQRLNRTIGGIVLFVAVVYAISTVFHLKFY